MGKTVFIKQNSPEIRKKLKQFGFSICVCANYEDSIWLDYHPDDKFPFDIHGVGYEDLDRPFSNLSPIERINKWLPNWSKDGEFFDNVEEFLKKYGKRM